MARREKRRATKSMPWLDISVLKARGLLRPGLWYPWEWSCNGEKSGSITIHTQENGLLLDYKYGDEPLKYFVWYDYTNCNYGGRRIWFICPNVNCGRRVRVLYGGKYFVCRNCHGLNYYSQKENQYDRLVRKLMKIRERLGCDERSMIEPTRYLCGIKPKGMHWDTYETLILKVDWLESAIWTEFDRIARRLGAGTGL